MLASQYYNTTFQNKTSSNCHITSERYYLKKEIKETSFDCLYCGKDYSNKNNLMTHHNNCFEKRINDFKHIFIKEYNEKILKYEECLETSHKELDKQKIYYENQLESQKLKYREQIQELQNKLEILDSKSINKSITTNSNIFSKLNYFSLVRNKQ